MPLTSRLSPYIAAVLLSSAASALAQTDDNRRVHHKLDLALSLVQAHDSDTTDEFRILVPGEEIIGGDSTMLLGDAAYRWQGSRVQVGATGQSVMRHYSQFDNVKGLSYSGGLGLSALVGGRTTLMVNQSVAYSPSYLWGLFARTSESKTGDAIPAAPDYNVDDFESYSYATTFSLGQNLTRRSRVSASGDFQYTDFPHEAESRRDLRSQGMRFDYARTMSRHTSLRAGYALRTGTFGNYSGILLNNPSASTREQRIDAGLQYVQPLSGTRRLEFDFNFGSSVVTPLTPGESKSESVNPLSGDVGITWQYGKSWQTRGRFRRGLEYVAGLREPVIIDGVSAELGGFLGRQAEIRGSVRYSSGTSALTGLAQRFETYTADARFGYALTPALSVYGEYLYYFYDFRGSGLLAPGIPRQLDRNGVRVGFALSLSALRR